MKNIGISSTNEKENEKVVERQAEVRGRKEEVNVLK